MRNYYRFAARRAAALPTDGSKYLVLLIITDGVISDMAKTKEEIVKVCVKKAYFPSSSSVFPFGTCIPLLICALSQASVLPLSIIIVGVGYDSFEEMKVSAILEMRLDPLDFSGTRLR